jgi:hypothetical protein
VSSPALQCVASEILHPYERNESMHCVGDHLLVGGSQTRTERSQSSCHLVILAVIELCSVSNDDNC